MLKYFIRHKAKEQFIAQLNPLKEVIHELKAQTNIKPKKLATTNPQIKSNSTSIVKKSLTIIISSLLAT